jgi:hypothetical protein
MQLGGFANFLCPFIWSCVLGLMRFLAADQKQQRANVCMDLCQIASDNATFLSRVITGDESWIYCCDRETKQQSFQWKMNSMNIIIFDIKGIVHKEFILAGQMVNSACLWRLRENVQRLHPEL